jgi:hypothetical protein
MTGPSIRFEGVDRVFEQLKKREHAAVNATRRALEEDVLEAIHERIRPKHEISNKLGDSVKAEVRETGPGTFKATYGPTADYARIIELGHRAGEGRPGSRPPEPWFLPGFKREVKVGGYGGSFRTILIRHWTKGVVRGEVSG